jgi:hypothetical protein
VRERVEELLADALEPLFFLRTPTGAG